MVGWEQLPNGWSHGDVAGVATDSQDRVYVFNRSEHPVIVYDTDGKFLNTWGDEKTYPRPHGITIVDDIVYLVDDGDHTVRKSTLDGKILMTLGTSGEPSDYRLPSNTLCRCYSFRPLIALGAEESVRCRLPCPLWFASPRCTPRPSPGSRRAPTSRRRQWRAGSRTGPLPAGSPRTRPASGTRHGWLGASLHGDILRRVPSSRGMRFPDVEMEFPPV